MKNILLAANVSDEILLVHVTHAAQRDRVHAGVDKSGRGIKIYQCIPIAAVSLGASKGGLAYGSSGQPRAACGVERTTSAAEVAIEVLPEDATHAV
ncbi:jg2615 [Pararge aegeria aegeria]|uniref:Jg2615 protein n=1 Tax=Pararge aegeria aegeria TaxID=348720 RepID=A0A8S4R660_9NEOP|nr:jg2615 [Pararge aegeria aegeria]